MSSNVHLRAEHAIQSVETPANEWRKGPTERPNPNEGNEQWYFSVSQWLAAESFDDNVVSIPTNDYFRLK